MKENTIEADRIVSEMESVRKERLSPTRTVHVKVENGRFETSRRSCSPECVPVPFH